MVIDKNNNRYLYKCSCNQLKKKPLVLRIISIINESNKKWITKSEINNIGKAKYQDWPKDCDTIFRALKTMSKFDFLNEKKRGPGQATCWNLNKKEISTKELMIHETKQISKVVSRLPELVFENFYYKVKMDKIIQLIRKALVDLENIDISFNWMLFWKKEAEMFVSKEFTLLDKQLAIIFIFCLFKPKWKLLNIWFDVKQIPYRIKADFDLCEIFTRNFYPDKNKEQMMEMLGKHSLEIRLCEKLQFLMKIYYDTLRLDYEYSFKLFDKEKFDFLMENKFERYHETIDDEKLKVSLIRHFRKNILLELLKKPDYTLEEIDQFIANYKELLASQDKKK